MPLLPVFHSHSKAGTRESPRPKGGAHGRDAPAPPLPPPPPPPPPLLRERSERAEAREHARELQAMANSRGSANGLPLRRTSEDLRKQVVCGQKCPALVSQCQSCDRLKGDGVKTVPEIPIFIYPSSIFFKSSSLWFLLTAPVSCLPTF